MRGAAARPDDVDPARPVRLESGPRPVAHAANDQRGRAANEVHPPRELDDAEAEGAALSLLALVGLEALDRPAPPHVVARALGYRLSPTAPSGCRGLLEVATATIRYDGRGSPSAVQRRLAHELAHVAALLADVSAPHAEQSIERIAAAIALPRPAVRAAVARVGLDPTRLLAELPGWPPWVLLRAGWVSGRAVVVRAGGERWAFAPDGQQILDGAWEREVAAIVRRTGRPHRDLLGAEAWPVEVEGVMGVVIACR